MKLSLFLLKNGLTKQDVYIVLKIYIAMSNLHAKCPKKLYLQMVSDFLVVEKLFLYFNIIIINCCFCVKNNFY